MLSWTCDSFQPLVFWAKSAFFSSRGEAEWIDVGTTVRNCEIVDVPVSSQSDVWRHFGFRGETRKGQKVTDRQTTIWHCQTRTNAHLRHFSAHSVMFTAQSLFNKCQLLFIPPSFCLFFFNITKISYRGLTTKVLSYWKILILLDPY